MIGLVRVPVTVPDVALSNLEQEIVQKAEAELSYVAAGPPPLVTALEKAGVVPFDPDSVRRYKWQREGLFMRSRRNIYGAVALVASLVGVLVWGVVVNNLFIGVPAGIGAAGALVASLFGLATKEHRWEVVRLNQYTRAVPTFVLDTALRIHRAYPHAVFYVDERRQNERAASDPFLMVVDHDKYGSMRERYWVEVWDEPNYREQRQA